MSVTAIILSHFKQRKNNLPRIIADLRDGSVVPDNIVVFIDEDIDFEDNGCIVIKASKHMLPKIRFSLGSYFDTDYCIFIDDDMTVRHNTIKNFMDHADPNKILGYQGSILNKEDDEPYTHDESVPRGDRLREVDVIIRTYFVPTRLLGYSTIIQADNPELPRRSMDDVYLCLGGKYLGKASCWVIPVAEDSDMTELDEAGVGQSYNNADHYLHRNITCRSLIDKYDTSNRA